MTGKIAEIMPEYPTRKSSQELTRHETEQKEQERKYTCLQCRLVFSAPIGKTNNIKHPGYQNVNQKETFGGNAENATELPDDLQTSCNTSNIYVTI